MAEPTLRYFETLNVLVQDTLDRITHDRLHFSSDRVIWELHGYMGQFDIRLKEIFNQSGRQYSYYVVREGKVVVGFDNYPDRRALRKKYGGDFTVHLSELIPHKHGALKMTFELTESMRVDEFLVYIQKEIIP